MHHHQGHGHVEHVVDHGVEHQLRMTHAHSRPVVEGGRDLVHRRADGQGAPLGQREGQESGERQERD